MLTVYDEFAGVGGSSKGATEVPGTELIFAANHKKDAVEDHARNFPRADHFEGDVARADITKFPRADIFWASPSCPPWSNARGKRRDFDHSTQLALPGWDEQPDPETKRARALMEEVPRYLQAMIRRGKPVLCGVVENVVECRKWDQWSRWLREVSCGGLYETRVIAINSMHVRAPRSRRAPQSRNRLFVAYWLKSLGRTPDWNKWLRPRAYCPTCDETVAALQVFKRLGVDMGTYGRNGQYVYRCPNARCRGSVVEPEVLPAAAVIDWSLQARRIADRDEPLAAATMERILRGIHRYATPFTVPAGGTWRTEPVSVEEPMPTRTTRETDALAVPPLLVPTEGRDGKVAASSEQPMRTQTARNETGLAIPPFQISLRGGGSKKTTYRVDEPMNTVSASGNHHGLVTGQRLLIPYYSTGTARRVEDPMGTVTTRDRWSLAEVEESVDLGDVRFRMLEPHEIGAAMAFPDTYIVTGTKRDRVRKYGNAVTPPVAEVIVSALVEAVTGEPLEVAW